MGTPLFEFLVHVYSLTFVATSLETKQFLNAWTVNIYVSARRFLTPLIALAVSLFDL